MPVPPVSVPSRFLRAARFASRAASSTAAGVGMMMSWTLAIARSSRLVSPDWAARSTSSYIMAALPA